MGNMGWAAGSARKGQVEGAGVERCCWLSQYTDAAATKAKEAKCLVVVHTLMLPLHINHVRCAALLMIMLHSLAHPR